MNIDPSEIFKMFMGQQMGGGGRGGGGGFESFMNAGGNPFGAGMGGGRGRGGAGRGRGPPPGFPF